MSDNTKDLNYYMSLPYRITVVREPGAGYFAKVEELPGCMTEGDTREEALTNIEDAMRGWIELALEDGNPIPEPATGDEYSGRILLRTPKSLHRELVERARREGVSLNQYIVYRLSRNPK